MTFLGLHFVYLYLKNRLNMRLVLKQLFFFFLTTQLYSQIQEEVNPPENIKTIIFKGPTEDQFPVIKLGDPIYLEFDDLTANEQDYYYKIVYCNYDWTPSELLKSQYLRGADNQRIINYSNSFNTLQAYSNYRLTIPNKVVSLKVSGNYVLEIYNSNYELQFTRRFVVYKDLAKVGATTRNSRNFDFLNQKQSVQFTITPFNLQLINPVKEVKVAIIQNYQWSNVITNVPPQFTLGNALAYKYDIETSFFGGNEFLNFDTSDLRAPSSAISRIDYKELYHHYLFTDNYRYDKAYTYFPDINGDFLIRTLQGEDVSRESEYTFIHFSLPYTTDIGLNEIYVYGKFNNYALEEGNKMNYNSETGNMEAEIKLKQGFYNYKYVLKSEDGNIDLNKVGGNFNFTENNYLILVYYRNFGDLYDSIIGIGSTNSENITN
jgi:hypothetical protein